MNLKAVLFLNGPAQLKTFVVDVDEGFARYADPLLGVLTYRLEESSLGPEGWVATETDTGQYNRRLPVTVEDHR